MPEMLGFTDALLGRSMLPVPDTEDVRVIFCTVPSVYVTVAASSLETARHTKKATTAMTTIQTNARVARLRLVLKRLFFAMTPPGYGRVHRWCGSAIQN